MTVEKGKMPQDTTGLVFAGNSISEGLFKFRSVATPELVDRVKQLLAGELYFSTYAQLNDPFEMRVKLELDSRGSSRLHGIHKSMRKSAEFESLAPAKRLERAARVSNMLKSNTGTLQNAAEGHIARMRTDCFIYCLSATRAHPLLWSHYADAHKGVCIQFDHTRPPFSHSAQVEYNGVFPTATYPFADDPSELTKKSILTKAEYWRYEEEYRLFSVRMDNPAWHLGLEWPDPHTAIVDPSTVVGLTLGANISAETEAKLLTHCSENHAHLRIEKETICDDRFAIEFDEL